MAFKRRVDSVLSQVIRAFDDFAAVVGWVIQADHFNAVLVFHRRLMRRMKSLFYLASKRRTIFKMKADRF
ncbi:hypothetical protein GQ57_06070 [Burkholderia sp. MSh2]|nr:hypothetical protein GQ57_06070 [Burkholderia sp. MSh2]